MSDQLRHPDCLFECGPHSFGLAWLPPEVLTAQEAALFSLGLRPEKVNRAIVAMKDGGSYKLGEYADEFKVRSDSIRNALKAGSLWRVHSALDHSRFGISTGDFVEWAKYRNWSLPDWMAKAKISYARPVKNTDPNYSVIPNRSLPNWKKRALFPRRGNSRLSSGLESSEQILEEIREGLAEHLPKIFRTVASCGEDTAAGDPELRISDPAKAQAAPQSKQIPEAAISKSAAVLVDANLIKEFSTQAEVFQEYKHSRHRTRGRQDDPGLVDAVVKFWDKPENWTKRGSDMRRSAAEVARAFLSENPNWAVKTTANGQEKPRSPNSIANIISHENTRRKQAKLMKINVKSEISSD